MSGLEQKLAAQREIILASRASRIAETIEAKEMAAPDLKGRIKKWIKEEVAAAMAKNDEKLMTTIINIVRNEMGGIISADEEYYAVTASDDPIPDPPKLIRQ